MYILTNYPAVKKKIHDELDAVVALRLSLTPTLTLSRWPPSLNRMPDNPALHACVCGNKFPLILTLTPTLSMQRREPNPIPNANHAGMRASSSDWVTPGLSSSGRVRVTGTVRARVRA